MKIEHYYDNNLKNSNPEGIARPLEIRSSTIRDSKRREVEEEARILRDLHVHSAEIRWWKMLKTKSFVVDGIDGV